MEGKMLVVVLLAVASSTFAHPEIHEPSYKSEPLPYYFHYDVHDDYRGTHFGQNEKSDGNTVYGSYTVNLPDGRKQTVDYTADHYNGYVAKVSYYGEAKHPQTYGKPETYEPSYDHGHDQGYGQGHHDFGYGH